MGAQNPPRKEEITRPVLGGGPSRPLPLKQRRQRPSPFPAYKAPSASARRWHRIWRSRSPTAPQQPRAHRHPMAEYSDDRSSPSRFPGSPERLGLDSSPSRYSLPLTG